MNIAQLNDFYNGNRMKVDDLVDENMNLSEVRNKEWV